MREQEILMGVLGKTLKMSNEDVGNLIYDGDNISETAVEKILNADAERVKRIRKEVQDESFNNGHKKGFEETMSKFEAQVRDRYGVKSEAQGIDLVEEAILKNQKTSVGADDVRKHPTYLELERSTIRKEEYNKVVNDFEGFKKKIDRDGMMGKVQGKAKEILMKMNPIIEDNQRVSNRRMEMFLSEFNEFDYEFEEDLGLILPVKDGKRVMDKHGNPVGFESLVRQKAENNFELSQQTRQSAGNKNGGGVTINVPRSKEEYLRAVTNETDPQKQILIKQAYQESLKNA